MNKDISENLYITNKDNKIIIKNIKLKNLVNLIAQRTKTKFIDIDDITQDAIIQLYNLRAKGKDLNNKEDEYYILKAIKNNLTYIYKVKLKLNFESTTTADDTLIQNTLESNYNNNNDDDKYYFTDNKYHDYIEFVNNNLHFYFMDKQKYIDLFTEIYSNYRTGKRVLINGDCDNFLNKYKMNNRQVYNLYTNLILYIKRHYKKESITKTDMIKVSDNILHDMYELGVLKHSYYIRFRDCDAFINNKDYDEYIKMKLRGCNNNDI